MKILLVIAGVIALLFVPPFVVVTSSFLFGLVFWLAGLPDAASYSCLGFAVVLLFLIEFPTARDGWDYVDTWHLVVATGVSLVGLAALMTIGPYYPTIGITVIGVFDAEMMVLSWWRAWNRKREYQRKQARKAV